MMKAYVWRSGIVCYGMRTPPEAMQLCAAGAHAVRSAIAACCEPVPNNTGFRIPGWDKHASELDALNAVIAFRVRLDEYIAELRAAQALEALAS